MSNLHVVSVIGADLTAAGAVTDLDLVWTGSGPVLYVTSRLGGGITAYALSGGTAIAFDTQALTGQAEDLGRLQFEIVQTGGQPLAMVLSGTGSGLPAYRLADNGAVSANGTHALDGLAGPVWAATSLTLDGRTFFYAATETPGTLGIYEAHDDGTLTLVKGPAQAPAKPSDIADLMAVSVGGTSYVLATSASDDMVLSYSVNSAGKLKLADRISVDDGLGINTPNVLAQVTLEGQVFVLVGAAGSSSISVIALSDDGALAPVDHVVDDLNTRFSGITALDAAVIGGRAYVAAAGSDDGVTLFVLLPTGRLVAVDTIADGLDSSLANIEVLLLAEVEGDLALFAGSAAEGGVTQMQLDPGMPGVTLQAGSGGGVLSGGAGGDLLIGGAGDDDLRGAGGDDILVAGAGADTLRGGEGADIFVIEAPGGDHKIMEFEPGVDRLDLSGWGLLRSADQLSFKALSDGIQIDFGDARLRIKSMDGGTISEDEIRAALIPGAFIHTPTGTIVEGQILQGGSGDDTLIGGDGDDLLQGMDGADHLVGGAGIDTVDYADAADRLTVDLLTPEKSTGVAEGDTFESIENLQGSDGRDKLVGDFEDNVVTGGYGNDWLLGSQGDDRLEGGSGNDRLEGGPGADVLVGGSGVDRAFYKRITTALVIDMENPDRNTGVAEGDVMIDVEELYSGTGDDQLYGTAADNRIWGIDGEDEIWGREGDDILMGGRGKDVLYGGPGDDILDGGGAGDTYVFDFGHDRIIEWDGNRDQIWLDAEALFLGSTDVERIVKDYAEVTSEGVVFDFGAGASLTLEGLSTTDGLADVLVLI